MERFYIFLDGGFITKKLHPAIGHKHAQVCDVVKFVNNICDDMKPAGLMRSIWYDAEPASGKIKNPISSVDLHLDQSSTYRRGKKLLDDLEQLENFAVRRGRCAARGWKLNRQALARLKKANGASPTVSASDFQPGIEQKGVDMKLGLDIARVAFRRTADSIIVVAGDSDLVPAMKLARIEGLRVYLHTMGHGVTADMRVHADRLLTSSLV